MSSYKIGASVRVLIVDDHTIVREGLRALLADEPGIELVGEATNGREALQMAEEYRPDVILMDLVMPEMDGFEAIRRIHETCLSCQILVLTSFGDDQSVHRAIMGGAVGYLLKDVLKPDLLRAIQSAARGSPTLHPEAQRQLMQRAVGPQHVNELTRREREVLRLISRGLSNKEIARALQLTEGTVKGYVSTVLNKLGVADRTQAAILALEEKWILNEDDEK